jgi:hypothetical protein
MFIYANIVFLYIFQENTSKLPFGFVHKSSSNIVQTIFRPADKSKFVNVAYWKKKVMSRCYRQKYIYYVNMLL